MFFAIKPIDIMLILTFLLVPLEFYLIIFLYVKETAFSPKFATKKFVYQTYKRENSELFQQFKKDRRKYYLYWFSCMIEGSLCVLSILTIQFYIHGLKDDPFSDSKLLSCFFSLLAIILALFFGLGQYRGFASNSFAKRTNRYQYFINPLMEKKLFFIRLIGGFILVFLCSLQAIDCWYE